MKNIAIFASGSGSNAENIISYFNRTKSANVRLILCNKPEAKVLSRAERLHVKSVVFTKAELDDTSRISDILKEERIDYIVLAGFLLLVPPALIEEYRGRIINIHPALLPKFGGKGMYGDRVHKAVIEAGETLSGITIHHVNELFDSGDTIFQATVPVTATDTPDSLAEKVHALEYRYFPEIIEQEIRKSEAAEK